MMGQCLGSKPRCAVPTHLVKPRVSRVRKLQELRSALVRVNEAIRILELTQSTDGQARQAVNQPAPVPLNT